MPPCIFIISDEDKCYIQGREGVKFSLIIFVFITLRGEENSDIVIASKCECAFLKKRTP